MERSEGVESGEFERSERKVLQGYSPAEESAGS
jgi:hypothetical protein